MAKVMMIALTALAVSEVKAGLIDEGEEFEISKSHGDELAEKGLAVSVKDRDAADKAAADKAAADKAAADKAAPPLANKMEPAPTNKSAQG